MLALEVNPMLIIAALILLLPLLAVLGFLLVLFFKGKPGETDPTKL
jgi:hypothetical protein